jgi:exoribonuclease II
MDNISAYLEKFKKLKNPRDAKENIARVIKEVTGFDIAISEFRLQKAVLFLNTNPYLRTEIYSKKAFILDEIKKQKIETVIDIK